MDLLELVEFETQFDHNEPLEPIDEMIWNIMTP
jgi:hypothetical protein